MTDDLAAIVSLSSQLAYWYPRAVAFANQGDGLRSPNLDGGGHGSDVADPVGNHVAAGVDHDPLRHARDHIASARRSLVYELASRGVAPPSGVAAAGLTIGQDDLTAVICIAGTLRED